jgi:hypothetical protein
MERCISEASGRITYQEIFVFSDPRRVEKLQRRLAEAKSGYSCRHFRQETTIPRLQFVIIDDQEVFFFASSAGAPLASFRSNELCLVLRSYFDVAWAEARPIKEGPQVYKNELAHIHEAAGDDKKQG